MTKNRRPKQISDIQKGLPRTKLRFGTGFTLVEVIIASAVFLIFAMGAYRGYDALRSAMANARYKALAADLANARFEIIKNLPYSSVGVSGGVPNGVLSATENVVSDGVSFVVSTTIENVDDPFDGVGGVADPFPNDYKRVGISIGCPTCKNFSPVLITGLVAPLSLENL